VKNLTKHKKLKKVNFRSHFELVKAKLSQSLQVPNINSVLIFLVKNNKTCVTLGVR